MKKVKDKFSDQSEYYRKYRPTYPPELYKNILKLTHDRNACWDCGTGNGQVAVELSKYFKNVYATDISENQIKNAEKRDNITYKIERAEHTTFPANHFDLIIIAQAIHWFDLNGFYKEVKRVARNGGVLSVWGYGLPRIDKNVDKLLDHFYHEKVGSYWDLERKHIDNEYRSINFDFEKININKKFAIEENWTMQEFIGYLNSWSSVQNFIKKNKNNPVEGIIPEISKFWDNESNKKVLFPMFVKAGKVDK